MNSALGQSASGPLRLSKVAAPIERRVFSLSVEGKAVGFPRPLMSAGAHAGGAVVGAAWAWTTDGAATTHVIVAARKMAFALDMCFPRAAIMAGWATACNEGARLVRPPDFRPYNVGRSWWLGAGSNCRPVGYESTALTI